MSSTWWWWRRGWVDLSALATGRFLVLHCVPSPYIGSTNWMNLERYAHMQNNNKNNLKNRYVVRRRMYVLKMYGGS